MGNKMKTHTHLDALEALDELESSAIGDEPFNHHAAPLVRAYIEQELGKAVGLTDSSSNDSQEANVQASANTSQDMESVLIDGVSYKIPLAIAAELFDLNTKLLRTRLAQEPVASLHVGNMGSGPYWFESIKPLPRGEYKLYAAPLSITDVPEVKALVEACTVLATVKSLELVAAGSLKKAHGLAVKAIAPFQETSL